MSGKAIAMKSLKEKWFSIVQSAKEKGEKAIGGSSTVTPNSLTSTCSLPVCSITLSLLSSGLGHSTGVCSGRFLSACVWLLTVAGLPVQLAVVVVIGMCDVLCVLTLVISMSLCNTFCVCVCWWSLYHGWCWVYQLGNSGICHCGRYRVCRCSWHLCCHCHWDCPLL